LLWRNVEANSDNLHDAPLPTLPPRFNSTGPSTPGAFIVGDLIHQINKTIEPLLVEKTPVLFGGGGLVLYLVVEAIDGPSGWVTPNYWRLGMIPFPRPEENPRRHLPAAIQRTMRLAMPKDVPLRLRWHFEGFDWKSRGIPLVGRSIEAAAACAALAIVERYRDQNKPSRDPHEKTVRRINPILDDKVAVTGHVDDGGDLPFAEWPIKKVSENTIQDKLRAAANKKIDTVCVAADQPLEGIEVPPNVRLEKIKTVQDAYRILDNYQDILDCYRDHVRSQFEMQWDEQNTPVTP
jgi:hypothetical protein